jgi:stage V sporulation protein B
MGKKTLIVGTLVLSAASFITRVLGFIFRIYMSNLMGAEGMGLYQLIFPIYMLIWSATSAGIALSVSKMVAEFTSKKQHANAIRTLRVSLLISISLSIVIGLFIYFFAPYIAIYFIHAPQTTLSLKILATCAPFMAAACCIRGYFQGRQEMVVPAIAQIGEQVMRMLAIYLFAGFFVNKGVSYACALGVVGMCFGEAFSFVFSYISYKLKKSSLKMSKASISYLKLFTSLFSLAIPITANRFLTSTLQSIENILIPIQLQKYGLSEMDAISTYGKFSGMALPLLFFPSMVTMSLSTVLVPVISEAVVTKRKTMLQKMMSKSIQFSALIGIGASALFLTLSKEIAIACYGMADVGEFLYLLAIICPFLYLQSILTGALNGLGLQKTTFKINIIGSIVCISLIFFLVPIKGILGFVIALLLQSGIVTILHMWEILKTIDLTVDILNWIVKPLLSAIAGSLFMKYIYNAYLPSLFSQRISTFIAILALGSFYIAFLFLSKCITTKDIKDFIK